MIWNDDNWFFCSSHPVLNCKKLAAWILWCQTRLGLRVGLCHGVSNILLLHTRPRALSRDPLMVSCLNKVIYGVLWHYMLWNHADECIMAFTVCRCPSRAGDQTKMMKRERGLNAFPWWSGRTCLGSALFSVHGRCCVRRGPAVIWLNISFKSRFI